MSRNKILPISFLFDSQEGTEFKQITPNVIVSLHIQPKPQLLCCHRNTMLLSDIIMSFLKKEIAKIDWTAGVPVFKFC